MLQELFKLERNVHKKLEKVPVMLCNFGPIEDL